ncbi:MAG: hypothetical protein ACXABY_18240 [Candidatus Thorarchaeota archaeon]|jgi:hypothetical protein
MTPERIARIRKSFTCADIDALCDTVEQLWKDKEELEHKWVEEHESWHRLKDRLDGSERKVKKLTKANELANKILTSILPQPTEEVDDTIREALDCLTGWTSD